MGTPPSVAPSISSEVRTQRRTGALNSAQCSFRAGVAEKSLARTGPSVLPEGLRPALSMCQLTEKMNEIAREEASPETRCRARDGPHGRPRRSRLRANPGFRMERGRAGNRVNRPRRRPSRCLIV